MKGAIFDMDGTLLDSMREWGAIGIRYMEQAGITPPPDLRERIISLSMAQTIEYMQQLGVSGTAAEIQQGINHLMEEEYRLRIPEKGGSFAFLRRLQQEGVRMCVLSATDQPLIELALAHHGIADCFDFVLSCGETGTNKGDPAIFELVRERLGTDRADTVVFEDALYAIRTAKQAGFRVVAISDWLSEPDEPEILALADQFIHHFSECIAYAV